MKDKRLRDAFVRLCRHLNVKATNPWRSSDEPVDFDHEFWYPVNCKLARKGDIDDLQRQIDELKEKLLKRRK